MARPAGCSLPSSADAARRSASSASTPGAATTRATRIRPSVRVPVLSRTTVVTLRVDSSASGPRTRIPIWAPRPVPTISAIGVASPSAQGQAMMSTETATSIERPAPCPVASHPASVARASAITTGTKTAETRSASRCAPALPACARSTSAPMRATAVSAPTRVARTTRRPPALRVEPVTSLPGPTSTGTLSPVISDASTAEAPSLDHAVGGHPLAGTDHEAVAGGQGLDRDHHLAAVAQQRGVLGPELGQRPQGGPGPATGAGLEPPSEQDQHDDPRATSK